MPGSSVMVQEVNLESSSSQKEEVKYWPMYSLFVVV